MNTSQFHEDHMTQPNPHLERLYPVEKMTTKPRITIKFPPVGPGTIINNVFCPSFVILIPHNPKEGFPLYVLQEQKDRIKINLETYAQLEKEYGI